METQDTYLYMRFDQYVSNSLSKEDQLTLEQEIETSDDIRQEFEGFLKSKHIAFAAGFMDDKASLHEISTAFHAQKQKRRRFVIIGSLMAAVIAILVAFITIQQSTPSLTGQELYAANLTLPEAPAPMGNVQDSLFALANKTFDQEKYGEAIALYDQIQTPELLPLAQSQKALFEGLSYLTLNNPTDARNSFQQAVQLPEEAAWYTALSWLITPDGMTEAAKAFRAIAETDGHYYQKQAEEILEKGKFP